MRRDYWRGHPTVWKNDSWLFEDTLEPIPGYGGSKRPCVKCGKTFEGSNMGESDPCLGDLPGVDNACCGHGVRKTSYIRFTNGVVVKEFIVEQPIKHITE